DLVMPESLRLEAGDATYLGAPVDMAFPACEDVDPDPSIEDYQFRHPLTRLSLPCDPGLTLAVLTLPFGSFVPEQPVANIVVTSEVFGDDPSVVGELQTISATPGFRF